MESVDSHAVLQNTIRGVENWCRQNGMSLSSSKCLSLQYGNYDRRDGRVV